LKAPISKPTDPISKAMCDNQRVRTTNNAMNFSTLGIVIIVVVGLLISTSLVLDILVGFVQRKWKMRDYQRPVGPRRKLQLQRLAYEEAGMGTWSGGTSFVPVTVRETFGMPPDVDPDHPRFAGRKESGSNAGVSNVYKTESGEELSFFLASTHFFARLKRNGAGYWLSVNLDGSSGWRSLDHAAVFAFLRFPYFTQLCSPSCTYNSHLTFPYGPGSWFIPPATARSFLSMYSASSIRFRSSSMLDCSLHSSSSLPRFLFVQVGISPLSPLTRLLSTPRASRNT
jgi:hypothetical protein